MFIKLRHLNLFLNFRSPLEFKTKFRCTLWIYTNWITHWSLNSSQLSKWPCFWTLNVPVANSFVHKQNNLSKPTSTSCGVVSGPCRWVPHEAGVRPEAVLDPERLPLGERRHQPPEPAPPLVAGGVWQEAHLAPRRDRHRPVWAWGRILLLQVQVGLYLSPIPPPLFCPMPSTMYCLTIHHSPLSPWKVSHLPTSKPDSFCFGFLFLCHSSTRHCWGSLWWSSTQQVTLHCY